MNLPRHIAFIVDGNRRWAKEKGRPAFFGHKTGADNLETIARACANLDIPYITFWVLSTENVKERSKLELAFLYKLMEELPKRLETINKENVRINMIGDPSVLPQRTQKALEKAIEGSKNNTKAVITFAIHYGGRHELLRAMRKMLEHKTDPNQLTEDIFQQYLDTHNLPDPDLIVRTGGARRLSGLLPWQSTYAELYFTDTKWPAFDEKELEKALQFYSGTQRNFGK